MMTAMRMKKTMLAYALPVSFIFWPPELDHSIEFCGIWGPVDHKVPPISTFSGVKLATCFFVQYTWPQVSFGHFIATADAWCDRLRRLVPCLFPVPSRSQKKMHEPSVHWCTHVGFRHKGLQVSFHLPPAGPPSIHEFVTSISKACYVVLPLERLAHQPLRAGAMGQTFSVRFLYIVYSTVMYIIILYHYITARLQDNAFTFPLAASIVKTSSFKRFETYEGPKGCMQETSELSAVGTLMNFAGLDLALAWSHGCKAAHRCPRARGQMGFSSVATSWDSHSWQLSQAWEATRSFLDDVAGCTWGMLMRLVHQWTIHLLGLIPPLGKCQATLDLTAG